MKELWELGEIESQKMFNLQPVSGSGRGPFGKGDAKSDWLMCDTKTTCKGSFSYSFAAMQDMKLKAAKERKSFFLHVIPIIGGKLRVDMSEVRLEAKLFKALLENQKDEV